MPEPKLDWSTAEVHEGKLTVALNGDAPDGWSETFETTAKLLGSSEREQVRLEKDTVHVTGLQAGSEDKLRHFLESVTQEANARHQSEADSAGTQDAQDARDDGEQQEDSPDAKMTKRFRAFAEAAGGDPFQRES